MYAHTYAHHSTFTHLSRADRAFAAFLCDNICKKIFHIMLRQKKNWLWRDKKEAELGDRFAWEEKPALPSLVLLLVWWQGCNYGMWSLCHITCPLWRCKRIYFKNSKNESKRDRFFGFSLIIQGLAVALDCFLLLPLPPTLIISHSLVMREMSQASCHIVTAPPPKMMLMKAAKDT